MKQISMQQEIESSIQRTARSLTQNWITFEFQKMLPALIEEVTKQMRVDIFQNPDIPEEIKIRIKFDRTETNK